MPEKKASKKKTIKATEEKPVKGAPSRRTDLKLGR